MQNKKSTQLSASYAGILLLSINSVYSDIAGLIFSFFKKNIRELFYPFVCHKF